MSVRVLVGDCRQMLATLPAESVQTCVTSPPYFGLRDYGHAGQIGLEPTPDAFVAELVAVFRDVRRVLRDDGTLWLNLGDSYASGEVGRVDAGRTSDPSCGANEKWQQQKSRRERRIDQQTGLPPKNLLGIPWRVAFALQQPYYAGKITDERARIWLAAMLDAEGCLFIHKRKAGQNAGDGYTRQSDTFSPGLEISNTHEALVARCAEIAGVGSVSTQDEGRRQRIYRWTVRAEECRALVRELYPHIIGKQHQARLAFGCPTNGERADAAHAGLKALHAGSTTDVDFAAPPSLFEPGYYLRSDVIWSKPNPMPESVTDRPTKAHEYLFLLTKSERYYYDGDAVAEPCDPFSIEHGKKYGEMPSIAAKGNPDRNDNGGRGKHCGVAPGRATRNRRTVWTVATQPYSGAHFATFPPALIEPCIKAGTSQHGCCTACGAPWRRTTSDIGDDARWAASCACREDIDIWDTVRVAPCTVLDPFGGAGTTGLVADRLGRDAILCELNPAYAELARRRITDDAPLFGDVA